MNHRKLWEIRCVSRDAVLWTSFTWEELEHLARGIGYELEYPRLPHPSAKVVAAMSAIHRAGDVQNLFSERVDELLIERHEQSLQRVATASADDVLGWCTRALEDAPYPVPGLIFAAAVDPRHSMRPVEDFLVWRLQIEGFRAVAFGKVEVIEV
jgi:hypothetical protein